jgi:hypothetical protein
MAQVLQWHEQGLDFADALHLAQSEHCSSIYTFDDKFVKMRSLTTSTALNYLGTSVICAIAASKRVKWLGLSVKRRSAARRR